MGQPSNCRNGNEKLFQNPEFINSFMDAVRKCLENEVEKQKFNYVFESYVMPMVKFDQLGDELKAKRASQGLYQVYDMFLLRMMLNQFRWAKDRADLLLENYTSVAKTFQPALRERLSSAYINGLGYVLLKINNLKQSEEAYRSKLRSSFDTDTRTLNGLAVLWYIQNNQNKAIEAYQRVIELDENNLVASGNLAMINAREGNYRKAKYLLEKMVEIFPEDPFTLYNLAMVYFLEDKDVWGNLLKKADENSQYASGASHLKLEKATPRFAEAKKKQQLELLLYL